jgi:hypothetical protein
LRVAKEVSKEVPVEDEEVTEKKDDEGEEAEKTEEEKS